MDGRTTTSHGFKSELWAGLALVLTVLALALYAMQTALFIDLAVWVQTQGKERVINAVRDYLLSRGVSVQRVYIEGRGESDPLVNNTTESGRAKNRRVEIELIPAKQS